MEFLDPKKQRAHLIRLAIGYVLIVTALILTTVILLYQAYGFGLKNGEVIQNGLIFVSSNPSAADIYVNGQKREEKTNVRLLMPAGQYTFELKRDGYRSWKRAINIEGGKVARFDYPLLFPAKLTPEVTKKYDLQPRLMTQSPDRRWLFVQGALAYNVFDVFDLTKPDKPPVSITLPETISTLTGTHSWKLVEWANDNSHVLLQHFADNGGKQVSEYVLVDRESPEKSLNLTTTLGTNPTKLELLDKKYDKYFVYSAVDHTLMTASLAEPAPKSLLNRVLAFKTHGEGVVLYATDQDALLGKTAVKLRDGQKTHLLRQVTAGDRYMLDIARYEGDWYAAVGAPSEDRTYVYKNPMSILEAKPRLPLVTVQVLKTVNPTHVSFSDNARFIITQGGQHFSVYDAETDKGYAYDVDVPMDAPQEHVSWMDGYRMMYVSGGKTTVWDFDDTNQAALAATDAAYPPSFDPSYKVLYTLAQQSSKEDATGKDITQFVLSSTSLRTPQDR